MAATRQGEAGGRGELGPELRTLLASNQFGLALLIAVLVAVFATVNPGFTSPFNLFSLTRVMGIDMVIGFAMMVVLVTGGLNLAVGSIGVAAVMVGGWAMQVQGVPVLPAMAMAARNGRISFFGGLPKTNPNITVDSNVVHYRQLHLHGANGSSPTHNKRALEYISTGQVPVKDLITTRIPLDDVLEAFDIVAEGRAIKVTVEP